MSCFVSDPFDDDSNPRPSPPKCSIGGLVCYTFGHKLSECWIIMCIQLHFDLGGHPSKIDHWSPHSPLEVVTHLYCNALSQEKNCRLLHMYPLTMVSGCLYPGTGDWNPAVATSSGSLSNQRYAGGHQVGTPRTVANFFTQTTCVEVLCNLM